LVGTEPGALAVETRPDAVEADFDGGHLFAALGAEGAGHGQLVLSQMSGVFPGRATISGNAPAGPAEFQSMFAATTEASRRRLVASTSQEKARSRGRPSSGSIALSAEEVRNEPGGAPLAWGGQIPSAA
jgi:hypothetical protein